MNLWQRLKQSFSKSPHNAVDVTNKRIAEEIIAHHGESKGRVITKTRRAEYTPEHRSGGRVVKAMPKQLQRIKEAQEKTEE